MLKVFLTIVGVVVAAGLIIAMASDGGDIGLQTVRKDQNFRDDGNIVEFTNVGTSSTRITQVSTNGGSPQHQRGGFLNGPSGH